jgi:Flp pilus assembly protein TadG
MARLIRSVRGRRWAGAGLCSSGAQSIVEFAIVVPLFLLLTFAVIDLGRLFFVQMTLQHAMRQAARLAVTGNTLPDPSNPVNQLSRVNSIILAAQQAAVGLDVTSIQISSAQGGNSGPARAGGPGDTVTIALTTNLRLITPVIGRFFGANGTYTFTVQTTFRNEPFPPSQTQ